MMLAADALGKGLKLSETAQQNGYESLKIALEKWQ
jgi:hypothetical protein